MPSSAALDRPAEQSLNDPLCLAVEGWFFGGDRDDDLAGIEISIAGRPAGRTALRFDRPDVRAALGLPATARPGFALLFSAPELFGRETARLESHACYRDGTRELVATREIRLIAHDHRENHYGVLADPSESRLFHRADIYTSGPSVSTTHAECLELIRRHLGPPPVRVLDVGCGFGSYGRALLAAGYDWFGVEVKASDGAELARLGLPHRLVDGRTLPFPDGGFDAAICIEVLEHIAEPAPFLDEIRRVIRDRALFSVPNLELIPYLHRHAVVPWHLLEGDHKNFFTRPGLHAVLAAHFRSVEILAYAPIPIRTPEDLPLLNHLFAVCEASED